VPYATKEAKAAWRLRNRQRRLDYQKVYYANLPPGKKAEYKALSRNSYRIKRGIPLDAPVRGHRRTGLGQKTPAELRREVIGRLGGECRHCGESDPLVLCIDHINGDGYRDRAAHGRGSKLYRLILIDGPGNRYQLLCANCNLRKAIVGGEVYRHPKRTRDP
jgi:5-methylcytosine-specific restriction endonuclease McrA